MRTNVDALQTLTATHTAQINQLFDTVDGFEASVDRANEGVAMALAMESPALSPGAHFGLSGGVGYYDGESAATVAMSARVSHSASLSAGVGMGFDSGEVGARGGFQVEW